MCGCGGFLKSRVPLRFILGTLLSVILQLKISKNSEHMIPSTLSKYAFLFFRMSVFGVSDEETAIGLPFKIVYVPMRSVQIRVLVFGATCEILKMSD